MIVARIGNTADDCDGHAVDTESAVKAVNRADN